MRTIFPNIMRALEPQIEKHKAGSWPRHRVQKTSLRYAPSQDIIPARYSIAVNSNEAGDCQAVFNRAQESRASCFAPLDSETRVAFFERVDVARDLNRATARGEVARERSEHRSRVLTVDQCRLNDLEGFA